MMPFFKSIKKNKQDQAIAAADRITRLQASNLPKHIAIITDGNGRWAKKRGLPRTAGHAAGMKKVREIIRAADELGIQVLTYYSFSTENWKRPQDEVDYLMKLPIEFLKTDLNELIKRNVKVQMLGEKSKTPSETQKALEEFEEKTKHNSGLILNFAINYGSRSEMISAMKQMINDVQQGHIKPDDVTEDLMDSYLFTKDIPDPDLVIRTSGEIRISNFLLWQIAYSELCFTDTLWPDFDAEAFFQAIEDFQHRTRRYGAVK
ncbi:isoprenyl transferase [Hazenella sp. IB182357]|uniref:Isoprenyl transferase n=1 Tax=Polycladospora coralii TaxID=2771432 RepID=A0A926RWG1_9BACL|nr:isoprenyl transferase [Polycladospora coralii]MBD1371476.1 isoprenyl transferase [Polycladospora coralii]MBS7530444.1 isoprenyl transferase [Polycladospora coralii]